MDGELAAIKAEGLQRQLSILIKAMEHAHISAQYFSSSETLDRTKAAILQLTGSNPLFSCKHSHLSMAQVNRRKVAMQRQVPADRYGFFVIKLNKEQLTSIDARAFINRWKKVIDPTTLVLNYKNLTSEEIEEFKRYLTHPFQEIRLIAKVVINAKEHENAKVAIASRWICKLSASFTNLCSTYPLDANISAKIGIDNLTSLVILSSQQKEKLASSNGEKPRVEESSTILFEEYSKELIKDFPRLFEQYTERYRELHGLRGQFLNPKDFYAFDKRLHRSILDDVDVPAFPNPDKSHHLFRLPVFTEKVENKSSSSKEDDLGSMPAGMDSAFSWDAPSSTFLDDGKEGNRAAPSSQMTAGGTAAKEPLDDEKEKHSAAAAKPAGRSSREPLPDNKESHPENGFLKAMIDQMKANSKAISFGERVSPQTDWRHDFPVAACFIETPYSVKKQEKNLNTGKMDTRYKLFGQITYQGVVYRGTFEITKGGLDGKIYHHFFNSQPVEQDVRELLTTSWEHVDYPTWQKSKEMMAGNAAPTVFTVPGFDNIPFRIDPYFHYISFAKGPFAMTLLLPAKT